MYSHRLLLSNHRRFLSEFVCFQDSIDVRTSAEPDCSLIITAVSVPPTCSAQQVTVPAGDGLALFCNEPLSIDVSNSVVQNLFMNPDCTGDVFSINAFAADTCISLSNSSASMGVGSIIYQGCADGNTTVTQLSFSDQECTVPLANQTLSPIDVCVGGSLFTCGSTQAQVTGIAPTDTTDSSDSSSSGNILTISLFFYFVYCCFDLFLKKKKEKPKRRTGPFRTRKKKKGTPNHFFGNQKKKQNKQ